MKTLANLIFAHWPLKLAALLLATVLYMGLTLSESTRSWTGPVPVEVLNAPVGGALLEDPGVVERIEYRAPDEVADALTVDSFRASIDLSKVVPRPGAAPVNVPISVFPVDPRVRVVDYSPTGTAVRLDTVVSQLMPVRVESGPLPESIELGPVNTEPRQVRVSGASSRVQNVRSVEGRFIVDASGINIDEDISVQAYDDVGAIVSGIDIDPATVRVAADVFVQRSYATVPVTVELTGEPAAGMRIGRVSVAPGVVTVSGENPDVNRLESVSTAPLDISGASSELVADLALRLPEEITTPTVDEVRVVVTFVDDVGSRTYEAATAIAGADPGLTYTVAQPSVSVVLSGPIARLDEVGPQGLVAELPVSGLEVGDNDVMPSVEIPRGTSLVRLEPSSVRVTVESPS